jgi:hypothetical protein
MSNGYPSSPLGTSPSPSPVLGQHHNSKCKRETKTLMKSFCLCLPDFSKRNFLIKCCIQLTSLCTFYKDELFNKLLHTITAHHIVHKQHSPVGPSRSTNLRVVIPTPTSSNMNSDDLNYAEVSEIDGRLAMIVNGTIGFSQHNRQSSSSLNTPVVALQTPIPGLSNYPVSTFGAQDFSMSSSDLNMITSWNTSNHNLGTLQHTR